MNEIAPKNVRYIKLGEGGRWERECLSKGIIRFGFGSASKERFPLCKAGDWDSLRRSFLKAGKDTGTATRFTNETQQFFEDNGETLWITFIGEALCWGQLTNEPLKRHSDGEGVYRVVNGGWRTHDIRGESLTKERLAGSLTKLAAYRGTSCAVDVAHYVIDRINGRKRPEVERAISVAESAKQSILELMNLLDPKDFEILVDLVFSTSGWRRLGTVGKTQKTLDMDIVLPSTDERALVQVKSRTTSRELAKYVGLLDDEGPYDRMFYVFHSGEAKTTDDRVTVIGPDRLAQLVFDAGLMGWLTRKVS